MLTLLCGGQGMISPGMFALVADAPEAQPVFAASASLLGRDPRDVARDANASTNRVSQILTVTAALAMFSVVETMLPERVLVTGYSVGEMAAWSLAGVWHPDMALRLTATRAEVMDRAANEPGRLAYVRGLNHDHARRLARAHGCYISILNPGELTVLGGAEQALLALCAQAREDGAARAELLDVHVAAHTPLLRAAVAEFEPCLRQSLWQKLAPGRQLLAGGDGALVYDPADGFSQLAAQIATPINWIMTLDSLAERGADRVLDLGPGNALQRGAAGYLRGVPCYAADGFRSIAGLRSWIQG